MARQKSENRVEKLELSSEKVADLATSVVEKLSRIVELSKSIADATDEVRRLKSTSVKLADARVELLIPVRVRIEKMPEYDVALGSPLICADFAGSLEVSGTIITINRKYGGGREEVEHRVDLTRMSVDDVVLLVLIEACNPGVLESVVSELGRRSECVAKLLEIYKVVASTLKLIGVSGG